MQGTADRRDKAAAQARRLAMLGGQLEVAKQRLGDLLRELARLGVERDQLTRDAVEALARLERAIAAGAAMLAEEEARWPLLGGTRADAERGERMAELALVQATAARAGTKAQWPIVDAQVAGAQALRERTTGERAQA